MKNILKKNSSLASLGLILFLWVVLVLGCGGDDEKTSQAIPPIEYTYTSAFHKNDEGRFIPGNASGSLLLLADGNYRHTRYIGTNLVAWKPGTYTVFGDKITLTPDDADEKKEVWKFYYSPEAKALSLMTDEQDLGFLLVMSGTEGMTRCEGGRLTFDLSCE